MVAVPREVRTVCPVTGVHLVEEEVRRRQPVVSEPTRDRDQSVSPPVRTRDLGLRPAGHGLVERDRALGTRNPRASKHEHPHEQRTSEPAAHRTNVTPHRGSVVCAFTVVRAPRRVGGESTSRAVWVGGGLSRRARWVPGRRRCHFGRPRRVPVVPAPFPRPGAASSRAAGLLRRNGTRCDPVRRCARDRRWRPGGCNRSMAPARGIPMVCVAQAARLAFVGARVPRRPPCLPRLCPLWRHRRTEPSRERRVLVSGSALGASRIPATRPRDAAARTDSRAGRPRRCAVPAGNVRSRQRCLLPAVRFRCRWSTARGPPRWSRSDHDAARIAARGTHFGSAR